MAKIALNYVARQFDASVALEPRFDAIRAFVINGIEPSFEYYDVDENSIIEGDKDEDGRYLGHAIVVRPHRNGVEAIVSLYNRFRHRFRLAIDGGAVIESRGHFFDTGNRLIHPLSPSQSTPPRVG